MKEIIVDDKTFFIPKRYTDKRKVEKEIKAYRSKKIKRKKVSTELEIPVTWTTKLTYRVKESNMYKNKWINHLGGVERVKKYIAAYKEHIKYDTKN